MTTPRISLILCVKDGMPFLPEALASVAAQTYRSFELVVQDAASRDGSVEVIRTQDGIPGLDLVSQPDGGIGDAYNRALARCRGAIVGSIDSDNLLEPDALEQIAAFFDDRPDVAAVYGGSNMVEADGTLLYPWMPSEFDLLRLLTCELVPPFAVSFFNRSVCGGRLRFDPSLATCADFELWLGLSDLPIVRLDRILGSTRLSDASMTRRTSTYDRYVADKTTALQRYFGSLDENPVTVAVYSRAVAGLHLWAAASVYDIERARTPQFEEYLERALALDPDSERAAALRELPATVEPEPDPEPTDGGSEPPPAPAEATMQRVARRLAARLR
jgi:glycosyltransferase involved in cell wall biosynthesis